MVDRCDLLEKSPAVVVDLDGTYVDGNTLKIYVATGLKHCLKTGHIIDAVLLSSIIIDRWLRLISHVTMKTEVLSILGRHPEFSDRFVEKVKSKINPQVKKLIDSEKDKGARILLATAAPESYVGRIWDGEYVATLTLDENNRIECRGEEKLRRVREWLDKNNCYLKMTISDHLDDAPLVKFNERGLNILVKPDKRTLRFFRELEPAHFLLIEDFDEGGVSC